MPVDIASPASEALDLALGWLDALNRRDADAMAALVSDDFTYSGMARTPPELGVRWGHDEWLAAFQRNAGAMRKPVIMTIVRAFASGAQAVIEAQRYGERGDGAVYANDYCMIFDTAAGKVRSVRDYCCTATAEAHFAALAAWAVASQRGAVS